MELIKRGDNLVLKEAECFDLGLSLDCGQAFRWKRNEDGVWHGVVGNLPLDVEQKDGETVFHNTSREDFEKTWKNYFDLSRDYKAITDSFSSDEYLAKATAEFYGIRVLNQEPWETVCSFIISQNNNIPRIKGIIDRLCESFGEKISDYDHAFPSAEKLAAYEVEDLAVLRAGFRAKYILDAARKVSAGEVDFEKIFSSPIEEGRTQLMKISGVGPKVAECALLYSFGKTTAFPIDVWVKRILAELYPNGLPECIGEYGGIAQQYLFHWRRNSETFSNG